MKTLHLNLKRKWFDMISSSYKTEEYREIKMYWIKYFIDFNLDGDDFLTEHDIKEIIFCLKNDPKKAFDNYGIKFKNFDTITFSNGFKKDRDQIIIGLKEICVGKMKKEWGYGGEENVFILKLGNVISKNF